jgi:hypothetical protein
VGYGVDSVWCMEWIAVSIVQWIVSTEQWIVSTEQ